MRTSDHVLSRAPRRLSEANDVTREHSDIHRVTLHPTAMASAALEDIESWLAARFLDT
jgi:hypothetical protein